MPTNDDTLYIALRFPEIDWVSELEIYDQYYDLMRPFPNEFLFEYGYTELLFKIYHQLNEINPLTKLHFTSPLFKQQLIQDIIEYEKTNPPIKLNV